MPAADLGRRLHKGAALGKFGPGTSQRRGGEAEGTVTFKALRTRFLTARVKVTVPGRAGRFEISGKLERPHSTQSGHQPRGRFASIAVVSVPTLGPSGEG